MECPVVAVVDDGPENETGFKHINASDYDPEAHVLFIEGSTTPASVAKIPAVGDVPEAPSDAKQAIAVEPPTPTWKKGKK